MIPGGPITCCAWEPNTAHRNRPQRLAAGSEGGILMVCNVEEDIQVTAIDVGSFGTDNIHTVSYSDDGAFLLVAGLGSKALVIDPDTHVRPFAPPLFIVVGFSWRYHCFSRLV